MKTKRKLAAVIATVLLGALTTAPAQAAPTASAEAVVTLENFQIFWSGGGPQVNAATDFSSLSVTSSQLTAANMTGFAGVSDNPSTATGAPLVSQSTLGTIDPTITGFPAIPTTVFNAPSLPFVGNFSASGSNDVGAPILNFPDSTSPVQANADLHNGSYASFDTLTGSAGTSSSSTLASTVAFTALRSGALTFNFDLGAYIAAYLTSGAAQSATSAWSVKFSMIDQLTGLPVGFFSTGDSISNNKPGTGASNLGVLNSTLTGGLVNPTARTFTTSTLTAGQSYALSFETTTRAQVERAVAVPEPDTLALLGIGLLGMGMASRKRKNLSSVSHA